MHPFQRSVLLALAAAGATACSSIPTQTFTFDAINSREEPQPALIVIDDDWDKAWENNQVVNVQDDDKVDITIAFPNSTVEVTVVPLKVVTKGGAKEVGTQVRSREEAMKLTSMTDSVRDVRLRDPKLQLFVLSPGRAPAN